MYTLIIIAGMMGFNSPFLQINEQFRHEDDCNRARMAILKDIQATPANSSTSTKLIVITHDCHRNE